jgi:uncharacterized protein (DUF1778 family)
MHPAEPKPEAVADAPSPKAKASRSGSEKRARSQVLYVRLTDSERREIEAAAKAVNLDPGTYARQMALAGPEERGSTPHVTTRPTRLPLRVSEEERAQIDDSANRAGLSTGSYVRAVSLKHPVTLTTRRPPVERAELARLLGLMGNATSNLNQIARRVNMEGEVELIDITAAVTALQEAAGQIIESMGRAAKPRERR